MMTYPKNKALYDSFGPAIVTLFVSVILVLVAVTKANGDPLVLAHIGTRFSQGDPFGTEGYDGQFVYYIALDPDPSGVSVYLDVPAYRYQRILLPLLARIISLGNSQLLPWVIPLLGVVALVAGTWVIGDLFAGWGMNRWYSLVYGLWAGFLLALLTDLPEPLAYGLVVAGILALYRGRSWFGWCLLGLSAFAKEVTLFFVVAIILAYLVNRHWKKAILFSLVGMLPFLAFQAWLWRVFGTLGVGSGGAMATPFEWIPFMGLFRVGSHSIIYLCGMLVVFGPTVILPAMWGVWRSGKSWLAGERNMIVSGLFLNALIIAFTPFSTFRETGGIIRFASGLVLAVLLFASRYQRRKVMNYSMFWLVLNVFLLKS